MPWPAPIRPHRPVDTPLEHPMATPENPALERSGGVFHVRCLHLYAGDVDADQAAMPEPQPAGPLTPATVTERVSPRRSCGHGWRV